MTVLQILLLVLICSLEVYSQGTCDQDGAVRLLPFSEQGRNTSNTNTSLVGQLHLCLEGVWGTVCGLGWGGYSTAIAVCRIVGSRVGVDIKGAIYFHVRFAVSASPFPIHLRDLRCGETETDIRRCSFSSFNNQRACAHYSDVGLACVPADPNSPFLPDCTDSQFRCLDGVCIPESSVCDGNRDCLDTSDEFTHACLTRRREFMEQVDRDNRTSLWLVVGLSLGLVVGVLLILVTVMVLCMLARCPLRKLYYSKPAVGPDHDEVVQMSAAT